jgi:hypothetical protein
MHHVRLAVRRVDEVTVSGTLECGVNVVFGCNDMGFRMSLVGSPDVLGATERYRVVVACASFGRQEVVVAIALIEMRSFDKVQLAAVEDRLSFANELAFFGIPFLQADAGEGSWSASVVPAVMASVHDRSVCPLQSPLTACSRTTSYHRHHETDSDQTQNY